MNQIVTKSMWCLVWLSICHTSTTSAQTFSNALAPNENGYTIRLQLNPDGKAAFSYKQPENVVFAAYTGTWQRVQDTLSLALSMQLGQYYMKAWRDQELIVLCDSLFAERFPIVRFKYADGAFRRLSFISRKNKGQPVKGIQFQADPTRFSNQRGKDYFVLELPVADPFQPGSLTFRIPFGSNATFVAGRKLSFKAVLRNGSLQTVGEPVLQTGHFTLQQRD